MNRLKLNADKTQLIWLGTWQQLAKLTVTQLLLTASVVEFDVKATNLPSGVKSVCSGVTVEIF